MNLRRNQQGVTTFWGISIILMEVVVVFFVFYILYFFWIENPTPTSDILIIRTFNKKNVISIPQSVNTSGWLDFSSSNNNFSLQYPADLTTKEDQIVYGSSEGNVFELKNGSSSIFSLRAFPLLDEEKSNEDLLVADVFTRIIGFDPSIYQSYAREVDSAEAMVFRQVPGETTQDYIYFMSDSDFFEVNFSDVTANILATFTFTN